MKLSKRFTGMLVLFIFTSTIYQNCGPNFSAKPSSDVLSSSATTNGQGSAVHLPGVTLKILPPPSSMWSSTEVSFLVDGNVPSDATLAWSNSLATTNGTQVSNSVCIEKTSGTGLAYTVVCPVGGTITVNFAVIEQGQIVGVASNSFNVSLTPSTPTPTPTPDGPTPTPTPYIPPGPQYLAGAALYTKNCDSCHAPLEISRIRGTIPASINAGIQAGFGTMAQFAPTGPNPLSATDIDNIVYALSHTY